MSPPDAQVVLDRGQAAQQLMADETFLSVIDDLSTFHLQALTAAPPGPQGLAAREHHHLLHYALSEIAGELTSRVQTADELRQLLKLTDEEDHDA